MESLVRALEATQNANVMDPQRSKEVEAIERRVLPHLEAAAEELRRAFPQVRINTHSSPVGTLTGYQGHHVCIDCHFPDRPDDQVDNVALIVGVYHLSTTPTFNEAEVCWGHPSGTVEAGLLAEELPFSEEALQGIESGLPKLIEALRLAVHRGAPIDE